jgi:hypothetical protein
MQFLEVEGKLEKGEAVREMRVSGAHALNWRVPPGTIAEVPSVLSGCHDDL